MDYPDQLKRQMDRAAIDRQQAEDAEWLKKAEEARKEGYASPERVADFLRDFQNEDGSAKE